MVRARMVIQRGSYDDEASESEEEGNGVANDSDASSDPALPSGKNQWSGTERNSSRSGSQSTFFGSWTDLDPFLESWNGSGMDLFIQEKNQFSSSLKEQTSPL